MVSMKPFAWHSSKSASLPSPMERPPSHDVPRTAEHEFKVPRLPACPVVRKPLTEPISDCTTPAPTADDESIIAAFLATRHSRDLPTLEALVTMEPWVAVRIVSCIMALPGILDAHPTEISAAMTDDWPHSTNAPVSNFSHELVLEKTETIQKLAQFLLERSVSYLKLKGEPSGEVPAFQILEHLAMFIFHVSSSRMLPKKIAVECFNVLNAFESHTSRNFENASFHEIVDNTMHGYLQHSIDADTDLYVQQSELASGHTDPLNMDPLEADYDLREIIQLSNSLLEAVPWTVFNSQSINNLYEIRKDIKKTINENDMQEIRLTVEYMMSNRMHSSDISESGKWFRQSGARKDRDSLIRDGLEATHQDGKILLTGDLLANYIKVKISTISLGLIPECCKELLIELINQDESTQDHVLQGDLWLKQSNVDAIRYLFLFNPQRYEIVKLICELCSYIMVNSKRIKVDPIALASVVKVDTPELVGIGRSFDIPSVRMTTSLDNPHATPLMDPSGEAMDIKKAQTRWHRAWGNLLCNPNLLPSIEDLKQTAFQADLVADLAIKCLRQS
ncbi:hypothetical protein BASA50_003051 [Batrachochytrium salamandrivorans]|uniref:Uncharacterized protein n=1 Tax=Batrachochytrium salamandrivorans TaxID=1357716 RepID=A0ABQ8FJP9_9FUNG|nr:hypothetical protein BASA50_003051 [Batrachochytrium salamandrivorans]KAH9256209.1 hypothetical protein BASA81_005718 [Batrachochytrium salamandrivorans]KAH9268414.1 hypothetical protein BASA83_009413 [Batrachochytrium salamandrivorans]